MKREWSGCKSTFIHNIPFYSGKRKKHFIVHTQKILYCFLLLSSTFDCLATYIICFMRILRLCFYCVLSKSRFINNVTLNNGRFQDFIMYLKAFKRTFLIWTSPQWGRKLRRQVKLWRREWWQWCKLQGEVVWSRRTESLKLAINLDLQLICTKRFFAYGCILLRAGNHLTPGLIDVAHGERGHPLGTLSLTHTTWDLNP